MVEGDPTPCEPSLVERHERARRSVSSEIEPGVLRPEADRLLADVDNAEAIEEPGKRRRDVGPRMAVDRHVCIHVRMLRRTIHGAPVR